MNWAQQQTDTYFVAMKIGSAILKIERPRVREAKQFSRLFISFHFIFSLNMNCLFEFEWVMHHC